MDHTFAKTLPPLDTLRAFEAAARTGSFSAAAGELNVTHGAVSRQIARLEHWLGLRVFERVARGVRLTVEGNRLYLRTREAFGLIADNSDRWSEPRGVSVVRLTSIPSVAGMWLIPRLHRLEQQQPALRVVLSVDNRQVDLAEEGIDVSVRCGRGAIPGRTSLKLFEEHIFPIAAPALAEELSGKEPAAILQHPLIHDSDAGPWRAWLAGIGFDYHPRPQDRRFEDYNLVLDATAAGLGIALARPPLAQHQIDTGRLVVVDPRTVPNPVCYWMDRPAGEVRQGARELALRIGDAAGVDAAEVEAFLDSRQTGVVAR